MKPRVCIRYCGVLGMVCLSTALTVGRSERARVAEAYGKLPLSFEPNLGQTNDEVKFVARGSGYALFLTPSEAVLALSQSEEHSRPSVAQPVRAPGPAHKKDVPARKRSVTPLRIRWLGGNRAPRLTATDELPTESNYFIGENPAKWRTHLPHYAKVRYHDIYPGVDLVYYGNQGQLEHDFIVASGADPGAIRFTVTGADQMQLTNTGGLMLAVGPSSVYLHKPVIYQERTGIRREVSGKYWLAANNEVGFDVGAYDRSQPLVIDPVLSYSTYLGGDRADSSFAIAVDGAGSAYVTGFTNSLNFPTANAIQPMKAAQFDAFVTKLSADGSSLVYSTYLGGDGDEEGVGIALDAAGNAYVTGDTNSTNFPTAAAFQSSLGGGTCGTPPDTAPCSDAFVTKLSADGSALVYSTYLGGNNEDDGVAIAVDANGSAYVTGLTSSMNFPTATPLQPNYGGGPFDAFITKMSVDGSMLTYSTFLGAGDDDEGLAIAVDGSGRAYVGGATASVGFPTTPGAIQPAYGGGPFDGFLSLVSTDGSVLSYSTFLGGERNDGVQAIAVDSGGNTSATGYTNSSSFPTMAPFQPALGGGTCGIPPNTFPCFDAFATKLNSGGSLVYSTYLGGNDQDFGHGIAVDTDGNAYIAGQTQSLNFPLASPVQMTYGGGLRDAFVTKLTPDGSALVFSTYLGGGDMDRGFAISIDAARNAYVTGITRSTDFPTVGAFQPMFGGGTCGTPPDTHPCNDAFVAKVSLP